MYENGTSPTGLVALSIVLPILGIISAAARFQLRRRQKAAILINDWMIVPALFFYIGMCICAIMGVHRRVWGYATPYDQEESDPVTYNNDSVFEAQFIQVLALGFIKLAALLFYYRIFCAINRNIQHFVISTFMVLVILWMVAMTVMNGLQCGTHISALWNGPFLEYCVYVYPYEVGFAISNFLLDFFIILIPIPKLWTLHMSTSRKFAVTAVFGLALVGLAGSIARMVIYIQLASVKFLLLLMFMNWAASDYPIAGPDPKADFRQAGLGFLAINLPPLWGYTNRLSAERVLRSARSLISLHSNRSRSPKESLSSRSNSHNLESVGPFDGQQRLHVEISSPNGSHDRSEWNARPTGIRMESSVVQTAELAV